MSALARLAHDRPRRVLAVASAVFVVAAVFGAPVTGMLGSKSTDFQDPSSQEERTDAAIAKATGQNAYFNVVALLSGRRDTATDPQARLAVARVAALLAREPHFQRLSDYASTHSPTLLSRERRQTLVLAAYASPEDGARATDAVRKALGGGTVEGMRVRFGGVSLINRELNTLTTKQLARAELIGLPILLILSFWFFRGLVAALLPPLVGGLSILLTFLALRVIDQFTPISVFALNLVSGMGLGLGIDYSLFLLYRYREELVRTSSPQKAIERTMQTVGRTVLYSSLTVAAAMTSLLIFPLRFLFSMGIGGAVVTLCDGLVALMLLPAVLVLLGKRIDALSPDWLQRRAARSATATDRGGWWRLAHGVVDRPGAVALLSAALLILAATPALHVGFVSPGADLLPESSESHQVETAMASDFEVNVGEATEALLHGSSATARRFAAAAGAAAGPLAVVARPVKLAADTWEISLFPHGSAFTSAQQHLLAELRALARPYGALVGGATAYFVDQRSSIAAHIPLALLIVLSLTACFLFAMTGSVTIPLKALAMNLLSVGVGTGLIVWIFQDGHLSGPLGFTPIGGLEESSLVLMIVLAFALATDYEVFVLARIKEAHERGLPNKEAIALGIERTGRIVTAAALLFCVAIGALASSSLFFTKQLGLGAALSVAVDASVVRALLVPALMALMGDWNWWAPGLLARLHAKMGLSEG